jgi:hypothetical protein
MNQASFLKVSSYTAMGATIALVAAAVLSPSDIVQQTRAIVDGLEAICGAMGIAALAAVIVPSRSGERAVAAA